MKPGEVWSCRENKSDSRPWYYLVLGANADGVDMVLLDSDDDPDCVVGDIIEMSPDDVSKSFLLWELVA